MKRFNWTAAVVAMVLVAAPVVAQVDVPRVSQSASISQTIGLTDIEITYSRPGVKDRQVWGELVPWNELWRTGANEATTIEFSHDVMVEGHEVPAGKYALFTVPGQDEWTVILNSDWDQPGSSRYDESKDVARFQVKPERGPFQEWMTFQFPEIAADSATIELSWKETRIPFRVEVDTSSIVLDHARSELERMGSWVHPFRAADYAFAEGIVNDESMGWIDRSIALQETWWNLSLKARMLARAGRTAEAKATAARALALAKTLDNPPDTSALEAELATW